MRLNRRFDQTPYTPQQVATAERMATLVQGVWRPRACGGLMILPAVDEDASPLGEPWALVTEDAEGTWMTTLPPDLIDHAPVLDEASGAFLTTGLGLGVAVILAQENPWVKSITVVEKDERVRRMVEPLLLPRITKPLRIVDADAEVWVPDERFGYAWLDHSNDPIPPNTVARYADASDRVECWYDVRARLKAEWSTAKR